MLRIACFIMVLFAINTSYAQKKKLPTKMKVVVMNPDSSAVMDATIKIYRSEEDYRSEKNQVGVTVKSNKKGMAKIKELEPIPYYVLVEKGEKSNIGGGVMTEALQEGKWNKISAIIE